MNHEQYMKRCLELAALGAGSVSPNPMVGSVIVHEGRIIGEGWHRRYGEAHAEVNAVRDAESRQDSEILRRATLYVNLEPCSHWGKTPPCADLIVEKGIPRVVIGCIDSYREVSGRGVERLRAAGVEVTVGVLEQASVELNRRFFKVQESGMPYIILKWAQTRDGYLDAIRRSDAVPPAWMTGEACRTLVHRWRAEEDAILVGRVTARTDNPSLTVRAWQGRNPLRVVTDRELMLDTTLSIFDEEALTVLFTDSLRVDKARENFRNHPRVSVEGITYPGRGEATETLGQILGRLGEAPYRVQSLLVEGGARLLNGFLEAGLWDEARVFTSSLWMNELYAPENVVPGQGVRAPVIPHGSGGIVSDTAIGNTGLTIWKKAART